MTQNTNHKIKRMKRQAYGFRDQEFFKLKILAVYEARSLFRAACTGRATPQS